MNTIKKVKLAAFVLFGSLLAVSCLPENQSIGDAGSTFVKITPEEYNMLAFDAKAVPQSGVLFEIRKDVANEADLNTPTTVVVKYDADGAMMAAYNAANHTNYIPLPADLGTITPAVTNGTINVNFAAGDFAKAIMINIPNAGNFDFSKSYALAFKVTSVSGNGSLSAAAGTEVIVEVLAKNKWDGIYTVTGTFVDYTTPAWYGIYPKIVELRTTGAATVSKYDADYGLYGYIFETGGGASQFGAFTPCFRFDANNNVDVYNSTVDALPRGRNAVLYTGEGAINKYDAAKKAMDVTYYLKQLTVTPQLRSLITEHYAYKGPR
jgi:hypothetical protein